MYYLIFLSQPYPLQWILSTSVDTKLSDFANNSNKSIYLSAVWEVQKYTINYVNVETDAHENETSSVGGLSDILKKIEPQEEKKVDVVEENNTHHENVVTTEEVTDIEGNAVVEEQPTEAVVNTEDSAEVVSQPAEEKADVDELGELDLL